MPIERPAIEPRGSTEGKAASPSTHSSGSKERRRLQDIVNRRVNESFDDAAGDQDLSELTGRPPIQAKQPVITHVIPVSTPQPIPTAESPMTTPSSQILIQDIPIDRIVPSPYQPRIHTNELADAELADSVKETGLLQPIVVRALSQGLFELVAGERRWRASKAAGKTSIPGIVRSTTDQEAALNAVVENLHRLDLTPLELAKAFDKILTQFDITHETLAKVLGIGVSKVRHAVRILVLPADILEPLLAPGSGLGLTHAEELLSLKENLPRLRQILKKLLVEKWSVERLKLEIGRQRRINQGAKVVRFVDRGEKGFYLHIRFHTNQPDKFHEIKQQLEGALQRVTHALKGQPAH